MDKVNVWDVETLLELIKHERFGIYYKGALNPALNHDGCTFDVQGIYQPAPNNEKLQEFFVKGGVVWTK